MTAGRTSRSLGVLVAAGLAVVAMAGCSGSSKPSSAPPAAIATSPAASAESAASATSLPSGRADAPAPAPAAGATTSLPTAIRIPAIGVSSSLQALGLLKDGSLEPPSKWEQAGWYADGVRPGDAGPAVIAGHVDSVSGPAVFFRLKQLKPGDVATVQQADGRTLKFVVDTVVEYAKNKFPTAAVYGPTALPVLRLITCTGDFDRAAHSYVDNLVVTTHLAA